MTVFTPKKEIRNHMKEVEKEMAKHKDFIDGEIKTITVLKSGFGGIRNNHKAL